MKQLLAILLAAMFLVLPVALAEEVTDIIPGNTVNITNTDVEFSAPDENISWGDVEGPVLLPSDEESVTEESNLSDTESRVISETIESSETEATENVSVTPDMPLRWGLKTWTEKFSLLLTFNKFKKAEKKLEFAQERLQEMKQMAAKKNLKALAKAQRAHAEMVAEVAEDQEGLADQDLESAERIEQVLQKHIQVLEQVQAKLTAKGVPTQGVDNALVKSRNAFEKFQNMNETKKAKISEKIVNKAEKVSDKIDEKKEKKAKEQEESEEIEKETE